MAKRNAEDEIAARAKPAVAELDNVRPKTGQLVWLCFAAWLIPGCGHYILAKKGRALIIGITIIVMFLFGLAMKGEFYAPQAGAYLESLGFLGEMCVGAAMPAAK